MKTPAFLFFLLLSVTAFCQLKAPFRKPPQLPLNGSSIAYTASVPIDTGIGREQLLHNAQEWYRRNFQSSDNRLTINNTEEGIISGPGIIRLSHKRKDLHVKDIFFTIDISAAKGSYQYKIDSIYSFEDREKFYYSDMYSEEIHTPAKPNGPDLTDKRCSAT